ncbi:PDxFFG protein, partial [Mycoplasma leonicaptivi]|uniref:PDxFFG protein n=1 Tax=Mycoplasma leonicaptivi TaxID=36742 RepID=UPI000568E90F
MKKLNLKAKILLSLGMITTLSALTLGIMFGYSNNSDERRGSNSNLTKYELSNDFSQLRDENNNLKPVINILDPLKKYSVGIISDQTTYSKFKFIGEEKEYDFSEFFDEYFKRYSESFTLQVKYGSFSFFNEYVIAVKPKQFIEFTKWFIENASWGPDLLTLESFRIVPGVEQNGNAITLGSHSTVHKEVSEIKFFPDAFFGSLPIYSSISGAGNGRDALTYSLFDAEQDLETVQDYLDSIPLASAIKNSRSDLNESFSSLYNPSKILNKEFLVLKTDARNGRGSVVLPVDTTQEKYQELVEKYKNEFNQRQEKYQDTLANNYQYDFDINSKPFSAFKKAKVTNVISSSNDSNPALLVEFKYPDSEETFRFLMTQGEVEPSYEITYNTFKEVINSNFVHFLDLYDIKQFENKSIWVYENDNQKQFFATKTEALNNIKSLQNFASLSETEKAKLQNYVIESINVQEQNAKKVLVVTFKNNSQKLIFNLEQSEQEKEEFNSFKKAIGDKGAVRPLTIEYTPEDISIINPETNKPLRGLKSRKYQIFNETYTGLVDKVLKKFPHLNKKQEGPHIERFLNDQGFYEYQIKDGIYYGLSSTDRIGLPLLIAATLDDFEGISTDFLKYVGIHEYGHHYTLDQMTALNESGNAVLVGGLSTRGGISEASYYSAEALRNYLKARTNLDFDRVNALGSKTDKGQFLQWKFIKNNGEIVKETNSDIWGAEQSSKNDNIFDVLDNSKRRFLQTFEGLQVAAKLRDVKLGDLFIANSFDENSGTLNPFISGRAKFFVASKDTNGNPIFRIKEGNEREVLNSLKDGLGNSISEAITWNLDGSFSIQPLSFNQRTVTENNEEKIIYSVSKINLFNKDGSPVINVALNEDLTPEDKSYIDEQISIVQQAFANLLDFNYTESGWNSVSTSLGGKIRFGTKTLLSSGDINAFVSNLTNRSNSNEFNSQYNDITKANNPRTAYQYLAIPLVQEENKNIGQAILTLRDAAINAYRRKVRQASSHPFEATAQVNNVLTFTKNENNQLKIDSKYTFPYYVRASNLYNMYNEDASILSTFREYANDLGLANAEAPFQTNFAIAFMEKMNGIMETRGQGSYYYSVVFLNDQNVVSSPEAISRASSSTNLSNGEFYNLTKKIAFNNTNSSLNGNESLYSAYPDSIGKNITNNSIQSYSPVFEKFQDFIEYGSVDFSKAKLVSVETENDLQTAVFNWDIDYVKTKIDFAKFKDGVAKSSENSTQKQRIAEMSDQDLANEIMKRFINSYHFIAMKDFNPAKDLVKNQAIFSELYGMSKASSHLREGYVYDHSKVSEHKQRTTFDAKKLQDAIVKFKLSVIYYTNALLLFKSAFFTKNL